MEKRKCTLGLSFVELTLLRSLASALYAWFPEKWKLAFPPLACAAMVAVVK